jgi:hypothetical protein
MFFVSNEPSFLLNSFFCFLSLFTKINHAFVKSPHFLRKMKPCSEILRIYILGKPPEYSLLEVQKGPMSRIPLENHKWPQNCIWYPAILCVVFGNLNVYGILDRVCSKYFNLWYSVGILWVFVLEYVVVICGFLWFSLVFCGFLWFSVLLCGIIMLFIRLVL